MKGMKKLLIALVILSGCSQGEEQANQAGADKGGAGAASKPAKPGEIRTLMGLYEGGEVQPKNQLCMVENEGEQPRFGMVVWGADQHSCSGSGTVVRTGDRLQLKMAGDEACTIDATIKGASIQLSGTLPEGCAYYCGAKARLTAVRFDKIEDGREAAAKATDLVGDPLC